MKSKILLIVLSALALSSCSLIAPQASPHSVAKSKVGFGLLHRTIPDTNGARVRFTTQPVYIVDATNHLAPSSRIVPTPPKLSTVIEQLLLGPSTIETSAGYSSALPRDLVLVNAVIRRHIGTINFATSLSSLPKKQELLAEGQLAFTAYDVGATEGIVIKVAGVVQELLLPNGQRDTRVTSADFESLLSS